MLTWLRDELQHRCYLEVSSLWCADGLPIPCSPAAVMAVAATVAGEPQEGRFWGGLPGALQVLAETSPRQQRATAPSAQLQAAVSAAFEELPGLSVFFDFHNC